MKKDEEYEYHGVSVTIISNEGGGGLQYEEINEVVDHLLRNEKGEYLRTLIMNIDENGDIDLTPTYSRKALDRIKKVPLPNDDIPVPDLPEREIVKPWPKPEGGAR